MSIITRKPTVDFRERKKQLTFLIVCGQANQKITKFAKSYRISSWFITLGLSNRFID